MEACRPATTADVPRIVELARLMRAALADQRGGAQWLAHDARPEPLADGYAALLEQPDTHVVVGTYDGAVVGFGVVAVDAGTPPRGVITDLFVEPGAREVGVGEAMVDTLLDHCRGAGCTGVDTTALPGDRASKNFFETYGFTARLLVMHRPLENDGRVGE